jgi:hypothetical protein
VLVLEETDREKDICKDENLCCFFYLLMSLFGPEERASKAFFCLSMFKQQTLQPTLALDGYSKQFSEARVKFHVQEWKRCNKHVLGNILLHTSKLRLYIFESGN